MDEPEIDGIKINPAARKVIAGMFVDELPEDLEVMKKGIDSNEFNVIREIAHKYQLRLRYLGLLDILLLSRTIIESIDIEEYETLHENCELLIEKLLLAYKKMNREGSDR